MLPKTTVHVEGREAEKLVRCWGSGGSGRRTTVDSNLDIDEALLAELRSRSVVGIGAASGRRSGGN